MLGYVECWYEQTMADQCLSVHVSVLRDDSPFNAL